MKRSTVRLRRVVVLERLADDPAGQGRGHRADLDAQLLDDLLALGVDLEVGVPEDPGRLGLRLLAHLGDDRRALLASLLADPGRLVARLHQLLPVLLLGRLRLGLGLLGLVELLADRLPGARRAHR